MKLSCVRPSVCLSRPASAAGLLLWARRARDIDRLLHGQQQPRRSSGVRQANVGSATLSVDAGS